MQRLQNLFARPERGGDAPPPAPPERTHSMFARPEHGGSLAPAPPERRPTKSTAKWTEEDVREQYLKESGVAAAIRDCLKGLFSELKLPDNPYLFLANLLDAYVDQSALWQQSDANITSAYDIEGSIEVVQGETKLCRHTATAYAFGLPHVLRLVSRDAAETLQRMLSDGLPDSFFPNAMPFSTKDGYMVLNMCSVQGLSALWRPSIMPEVPEITVRADVIVKGPRIEEAVRLFIDQVLTELEDIHNVPVYFVEGIEFLDPPSQLGEGAKEPFRQFFSLAEIYGKPEDFDKASLRHVLSNKIIKMTCVAMMDTSVPTASTSSGPQGASPTGAGGGLAGASRSGSAAAARMRASAEAAAEAANQKLLFKVATKYYYLHYSSLEASRVGYDQVTHHGTLPYEAMYQGYFLTAAAARQYLTLYAGEAPASRNPYSKENLEANTDSLRRQIERGLQQQDSLDAFRQALLMVMLADERVTQPPRLSQAAIRGLEEACTASYQDAGRRGRGEGPQVSDLILRTVPNLLRILNSLSATINGMSRELHATIAVFRSWPSKLASLQHGANAQTPSSVGSSNGESAPGTAESRRTLRTPEVSSATLKWLRTFDMEARLLSQLMQLKQRARAAVGAQLFSGFSVMVDLVSREIPDEMPKTGTTQLLARAQSTIYHMMQLLNAISLTIAHGFLGRCLDVTWALKKLKVKVSSLVDLYNDVDAAAMADDGLFIPDWVLDVKAMEASQVKGGGLAARVATEGVMLQYAVDTHLDELLAALWMQVTQPPMPLNPYPKLMSMIRSHATKMELWHDSHEEALHHLLNDLVLMEQPSFVYAARPSANALTQLRKLTAGQQGVQLDEEAWVVYGSYCAVALADARALQALRSSMGDLMEDRDWHKGGCEGQVIHSLIGDAPFSNAMRLDDMAAWTTAVKAGLFGKKKSVLPAAFEHPRFFTVEEEEHHMVQGPKRKEAAAAFAQDVLDALERIHRTTLVQHVLHRLEVVWDNAAGGAPSRSASHRSHRPALAFTLSDLLDPAARQQMAQSLATAALRQHQGSHVATAFLSIASAKENMYVAVHRRFTFRHAKQAPLLVLNAAMTHDALSAREPPRPTTADREALYWDRYAYMRIFFTESAASVWHSWDNERGDPAQPFQYQHMVSEAMREMRSLQSQGRMLEMLKLMLLCAVAVQDDTAIYQLSRSCLSTAQELNTLMDMNEALVDLMGGSHGIAGGGPAAGGTGEGAAAGAPQLDNERLRHTFLVYYSRMRRAFNSPKYNYLNGLSTLAPKQLDELHSQVLSTFKLGPRELAMMDNLNVWTRACEISVANALLDCFDAAVLTAMRGPG